MMPWRLRWWVALGALCGCNADMQDPVANPTPCVIYCTYAFQTCINAYQLYTTWDDCASHCAAFPTDGVDGATSGNTLQCRLTFVEIAAQSPEAFCLNASPEGGTNCM